MMSNESRKHEPRLSRLGRGMLVTVACLLAGWLAAVPLAGRLSAADGEGAPRREGDRPREGARPREGDRPREGGAFRAERMITVRAGVVEGWLAAEARSRSGSRRTVWATRLARVKGRERARVRYDGPFVVITHGDRKFVLQGETGQVVQPGKGGEAAAPAARARELDELRAQVRKLQAQLKETRALLERLERGRREGGERVQREGDRAREGGDRVREGDRERRRDGEGGGDRVREGDRERRPDGEGGGDRVREGDRERRRDGEGGADRAREGDRERRRDGEGGGDRVREGDRERRRDGEGDRPREGEGDRPREGAREG